MRPSRISKTPAKPLTHSALAAFRMMGASGTPWDTASSVKQAMMNSASRRSNAP
jgi:hypothetical protein